MSICVYPFFLLGKRLEMPAIRGKMKAPVP